MPISISLSAKTAIVAGGGRGIGAAIAQYLAEADANVVVVDKVAERASGVAGTITDAGGQAESLAADLLDPASAENIVTHAKNRFGTVDILVNVAGGAWAYVPYRRMHEVPDDEWRLVLDTNLNYVFTLSRSVVAAMVVQGSGGVIVNIASISGVFSSPNSSAYGAAKAGVISFTRSVAHEYAKDGIRVNAVAPGRIETPAVPAETLTSADDLDYLETIPMGFLGEPLDIARGVLFFASDLARYVTGQTLLVDGGASTTSAILPPRATQSLPSTAVRGRA